MLMSLFILIILITCLLDSVLLLYGETVRRDHVVVSKEGSEFNPWLQRHSFVSLEAFVYF